MMNPMMMNKNNVMMNPMGNNMMSQDMMNQMMMSQNNGMMNPMGNNMMMGQDIMNQMMMLNMMMNQMNMMNQNMINQTNNDMMIPGLNFNDNMAMNQMGNNKMMMNQDNIYKKNNLNNANNLDIYFGEGEYIDSISKNIFSGNEDGKTLNKKLHSIYSNLKKKYIEDHMLKK